MPKANLETTYNQLIPGQFFKFNNGSAAYDFFLKMNRGFIRIPNRSFEKVQDWTDSQYTNDPEVMVLTKEQVKERIVVK
jgi:hypothetical protein